MSMVLSFAEDGKDRITYNKQTKKVEVAFTNWNDYQSIIQGNPTDAAETTLKDAERYAIQRGWLL